MQTLRPAATQVSASLGLTANNLSRRGFAGALAVASNCYMGDCAYGSGPDSPAS